MKLNSTNNTGTTLSYYFSKVEDIQEMSSNGKTPISEAEFLAEAYVNTTNTSIHNNIMEQWENKIRY